MGLGSSKNIHIGARKIQLSRTIRTHTSEIKYLMKYNKNNENTLIKIVETTEIFNSPLKFLEHTRGADATPVTLVWTRPCCSFDHLYQLFSQRFFVWMEG